MLHGTNRFGTSYSPMGRHDITIKGEMIAQSFSQGTTNPTLKNKGKVTLLPMSICVVGMTTPAVQDTNNLYELYFDIFQLPGVIPLDILHSDMNSFGCGLIHTYNTFCSHIATTLVLQRPQDWYIFL